MKKIRFTSYLLVQASQRLEASALLVLTIDPPLRLYLFHEGEPRAPERAKYANTGTYACALAQTAPLLSKPREKAMASFRRECWPLVALYLGGFDWKVYTKILLAKRHIA